MDPPLIPLGNKGAVFNSVVIDLILDKPLSGLDFLYTNGVIVEYGSDAAFLVPEPSTLALLILGSLVLFGPRLRRR